MRSAILVTSLILLPLAGVATYFASDLRRLWSGDPPTKAAVPLSSSEQKEEDARKKFAFESLIERLPRGKPVSPSRPLDAEASKRWEQLDRNLADAQNRRAELLRALHEKTQKFFIESDGFGPMRPTTMISPEMILLDSWYYGDTPQPGEPADFPVSPGEPLARITPNEEFHLHHEIGLKGFLPASGFGYVKDRKQVAGFRPHGFRHLYLYVQSQHWRIEHVQLVGILTQPEPVVYLTDGLPSMDQVRKGKVRQLDFFEQAALPAVYGGEDLYIVSKDNTIRMLGALRATKVCQKCHDAEIGDLLGAFSYTLRPAPKATGSEP
jgi:hypothetical protein